LSPSRGLRPLDQNFFFYGTGFSTSRGFENWNNFEFWTWFDIKIIQNTFYGFQLGFFKIRYLIIHLIFLKRKQQKNFSLNYSTGFSASREVGNWKNFEIRNKLYQGLSQISIKFRDSNFLQIKPKLMLIQFKIWKWKPSSKESLAKRL